MNCQQRDGHTDAEYHPHTDVSIASKQNPECKGTEENDERHHKTVYRRNSELVIWHSTAAGEVIDDRQTSRDHSLDKEDHDNDDGTPVEESPAEAQASLV